MATQSWISPSAASKYGGAFVQPGPATRDDSPLTAVAGPPVGRGQASLFRPDPPLIWIGGIIAAAFGLAAVSTTVRVGSAKASASVGDA